MKYCSFTFLCLLCLFVYCLLNQSISETSPDTKSKLLKLSVTLTFERINKRKRIGDSLVEWREIQVMIKEKDLEFSRDIDGFFDQAWWGITFVNRSLVQVLRKTEMMMKKGTPNFFEKWLLRRVKIQEILEHKNTGGKRLYLRDVNGDKCFLKRKFEFEP